MSQASKVASSVLGPVLLGLLVSSLASGYMGCKKDEPPPPLPSAAPAAVPTPTAPLELAPEEPPATSASASVKKPTGVGVPAQAAAACNSLVAAGKSGPGVVSAIQGLLRGIGMPSACL